MPRPSVFLSATREDLREYIDAAAEAAGQADFDVVMQERFAPGDPGTQYGIASASNSFRRSVVRVGPAGAPRRRLRGGGLAKSGVRGEHATIVGEGQRRHAR